MRRRRRCPVNVLRTQPCMVVLCGSLRELFKGEEVCGWVVVVQGKVHTRGNTRHSSFIFSSEKIGCQIRNYRSMESADWTTTKWQNGQRPCSSSPCFSTPANPPAPTTVPLTVSVTLTPLARATLVTRKPIVLFDRALSEFLGLVLLHPQTPCTPVLPNVPVWVRF